MHHRNYLFNKKYSGTYIPLKTFRNLRRCNLQIDAFHCRKLELNVEPTLIQGLKLYRKGTRHDYYVKYDDLFIKAYYPAVEKSHITIIEPCISI